MGCEIITRPFSQPAFAAIDFESAGAAPGETDQPVQVGIVRARNLFDGPLECFSSYLACDHPVRWSASKVHGITTAHLKDAPSILSLWGTFRRLLSNCIVVGHNPATEQRFLRVFPAHGFGPWLDTLALARHCMPGLADYSLGSVCEALRITGEVQLLVPGRSWHHALFDAAASLALLRSVATGLQLHERPIEVLSFAIKP